MEDYTENDKRIQNVLKKSFIGSGIYRSASQPFVYFFTFRPIVDVAFSYEIVKDMSDDELIEHISNKISDIGVWRVYHPILNDDNSFYLEDKYKRG